MFSSFHQQPPSHPGAMEAMAYYFIKNQHNGLYITVQGSILRPSGIEATYKQPEGSNDAQLWYDDPTGTIRSKANNLCIDLEGERAMLTSHQPGSSTQMWERCGTVIRRRTAPTVVLAIGESAGAGSPIVAQMSSGAWTQLYDFLYWTPSYQPVAPSYGFAVPSYPAMAVPAAPSPAEVDRQLKSHQFYIYSELSNKVLDIKGGNPALNTPLIMWDRKPHREANQLWYSDSQGFIYSALNDFVFEPTGPGGKLSMRKYSANPRHQWSMSGNRIMNKTNECLDIVAENRSAGAELCAYQYKGSTNQHWRIEYV